MSSFVLIIIICVWISQKIVYPFCPIPWSPFLLFLYHFPRLFFSLLDNFLFFLVQQILHQHIYNPLYFSRFRFSLFFKSASKRKTFSFCLFQKFPVLENFFRMQRYEIISTSKQKTNFFFKKTQKKLFSHAPTPSIVHWPPFSPLISSTPSLFLSSIKKNKTRNEGVKVKKC